jgi:hypothetical protein
MAIGDWTGEEMPVRELGPIPPDPENMNDMRASWANTAIEVFQSETGTDDCDALADLLVDLMHLCDRDGRFEEFDVALDKARRGYKDETLPFDDADEVDEADVVGTTAWVIKRKIAAQLVEEEKAREASAIDWDEPIEWSTGEEAGFAPYDDHMPGHHVTACRAWIDVTGDNYVAVDDDGEILGCEDEGYPIIRNVVESDEELLDKADQKYRSQTEGDE